MQLITEKKPSGMKNLIFPLCDSFHHNFLRFEKFRMSFLIRYFNINAEKDSINLTSASRTRLRQQNIIQVSFTPFSVFCPFPSSSFHRFSVIQSSLNPFLFPVASVWVPHRFSFSTISCLIVILILPGGKCHHKIVQAEESIALSVAVFSFCNSPPQQSSTKGKKTKINMASPIVCISAYFLSIANVFTKIFSPCFVYFSTSFYFAFNF